MISLCYALVLQVVLLCLNVLQLSEYRLKFPTINLFSLHETTDER